MNREAQNAMSSHPELLPQAEEGHRHSSGMVLGIVGDTQRSFCCSGKQLAFISEINSQMPSDLEAWQCLLQTDSAVPMSWPKWEGPPCADEVEVMGIGARVRVGILALSLPSYQASIFSSHTGIRIVILAM